MAADAAGVASLRRPRILIIDADRQRGKLLAVALDFMDMAVASAGGLADATELLNQSIPDVIIVGLTGDETSNDGDGERLLTRLQLLGTPAAVFVLTNQPTPNVALLGGRPSQASSVVEVIVAGPDDLQLLTDAVRRSVGRLDRPAASRRNDVRVGELVLERRDLAMRVGDQQVSLSPTEGRLLRVLMTNADQVVPKPAILDAVWNYDFGGRTNIVETYVSYVRRKLSDIDGPEIETVRGRGYVLRSN